MRKTNKAAPAAPTTPTQVPMPFPDINLLRGEYRPVLRTDLTDFGVAYFKAHPGYGNDPQLPGKILAFWEHYFDTKEVPGIKANPIQLFFLSFCSLDAADLATDETPGCAAGLNAACITGGFKGSRGGTKGKTSAGATSFMTCGIGVDEAAAEFGTILVMKHLTGGLKGHYHVTTVVTRKGNIWACRGNNQNNCICVGSYDLKNDHQIVALRKPVPLVG
jgi:hypothetical protein